MRIALLAILLIPACATVRTTTTPADNPELAAMAAADQAERQNNDPDVGGHDEQRLKRVLQLLAQSAVRTPQDKFNAALVLQHTGLRFVGGELVSASADNYLLAHHLFNEAWQAGVSDARYLVAASIDRYLSFTVGTQKYGTNRVFNQENGQEEWVPIDRSVSDAERERFGVPPLAKLLAQYPEAKRKQP